MVRSRAIPVCRKDGSNKATSWSVMIIPRCLRARRRRERWTNEDRRLYQRHRTSAPKDSMGQGKDLAWSCARCPDAGLANMKIRSLPDRGGGQPCRPGHAALLALL